MKKRKVLCIAIVIILILIFCITPFTILSVSSSKTINNSLMDIGDYIIFGRYNNDPIIWRIIAFDSERNPILFSDKILTVKAFDSAGNTHTNEDDEGWRKISGSNLWRDSNLRQWLNNSEYISDWIQSPPNASGWYESYKPYDKEKGFLSDGNFTELERRMIKPVLHKSLLSEHDISLKTGGSEPYKVLTSTLYIDDNYYSAYYMMVEDSVFLLDTHELDEYVYKNIDGLGSDFLDGKLTEYALSEMKASDKERYAQKGDWWYWLRTPDGETAHTVALGVQNTISFYNAYSGQGVRPALKLDKEAFKLLGGTGEKASPYNITYNEDYNPQPHEQKPEKNLNMGSYLVFGKYDSEPILWRIIDIDMEGNPLILSDRIITTKAYDSAGKKHTNQSLNREEYGSNLWRDSNLRQWLNSKEEIISWIQNPPSSENLSSGMFPYDNEKGFLANGNFTEKERNMILKTTYNTSLSIYDENVKDDGTYNPNFHISNIEKGALPDDDGLYQSLSDYIYILSMRELREYVYLRSNILGSDYYVGKATKRLSDVMSSKGNINWIPQYWMRLPNLNTDNLVGVIGPKLEKFENNNIFIAISNGGDIGVRPACRLNLEDLDISNGNGTLTRPYIINSGDGLTPINLNEMNTQNIDISDLENETADTSISSWAENEVSKAIDVNLIPEDMRCAYKQNITREEFARLCLACIELSTGKRAIDFMKESDIPTIQTPFLDSDNFSLLCSKSLEIINGYNNYANPKDFITREQAAVMLMNLGKVLKCQTNTNIDTNYIDNDAISSWARDGVRFVSNSIDPVTNLPIMLGSNRIFNPKGYYTREQAYMTVLKVYRLSKTPLDELPSLSVPAFYHDTQQNQLRINGTISLPGNDIAPSDGLIIYVGCQPENTHNGFCGPQYYMEAGKNSIRYSLVVDESYKDYRKFIVMVNIPNFLEDGSRYKQTPYSDLSVFYSSKGSTTDIYSAEIVDLKDGVVNNIDITLQREL